MINNYPGYDPTNECEDGCKDVEWWMELAEMLEELLVECDDELTTIALHFERDDVLKRREERLQGRGVSVFITDKQHKRVKELIKRFKDKVDK